MHTLATATLRMRSVFFDAKPRGAAEHRGLDKRNKCHSWIDGKQRARRAARFGWRRDSNADADDSMPYSKSFPKQSLQHYRQIQFKRILFQFRDYFWNLGYSHCSERVRVVSPDIIQIRTIHAKSSWKLLNYLRLGLRCKLNFFHPSFSAGNEQCKRSISRFTASHPLSWISYHNHSIS